MPQSGREFLARYAIGNNIAVPLFHGQLDEISRRFSIDAVNRSSGSRIKRERVAPGRAVMRVQ